MTTIFKSVIDGAISTLAATLGNGVDDLTLSVQTGHGGRFEAPRAVYAACYAMGEDGHSVADLEIVLIEDRSGDALTIVRGQCGTTRAEHPAGSVIAAISVAALFEDAYAAINAIESGERTLESLDVSGVGSFGGTLTAAGAGTGLHVTENAVIGLTCTAAVFDGHSLQLSSGATIGGTLDVTGVSTLDVLKVNKISRADDWVLQCVEIEDNLNVYGALNVSTGMSVIDGTLTVSKSSGTGLAVTANATIGGTIGVTGAATIGGTLGVTGALTASKSTGTGLAVTANATVGGTLGVTGATTIGSALDVTGALSATKATGTGLAVTANATIGGTLWVMGSATLQQGLTLYSSESGTSTGTSHIFSMNTYAATGVTPAPGFGSQGTYTLHNASRAPIAAAGFFVQWNPNDANAATAGTESGQISFFVANNAGSYAFSPLAITRQGIKTTALTTADINTAATTANLFTAAVTTLNLGGSTTNVVVAGAFSSSGSGTPTGGANGDIRLQTDGIWQRRSGTWTKITT